VACVISKFRAISPAGRGPFFNNSSISLRAGSDKALNVSASANLHSSFLFKNASAFLLRDARHAMHDILLLRILAILPEAISDGGLTPTTDTDLLLATYRGGSNLENNLIR
jgi:hypothetical protein